MISRIITPVLLVVLSTASVSATVESQLQGAVAGDVIDLGTTLVPGDTINQSNPLLANGGTLVYSDDPETAGETGILYQDTLTSGTHRVYLYHVNGTASPKKFSIVLENEGTQPAHVTQERKSLPAPSGNYIAIGRQGVQDFYENSVLPGDVVIPVGQAAILDPALETEVASLNQLVAGIYQYTTDQPLTVSTVMLSPADDTLAVYPSLGFAANDGSNRQGTFPGFNRVDPGNYLYDTNMGVRKLRIAGGPDPAISGTNAESEVPTTLPGNYGVTYEIDISLASDDGKNVALLVNPRGGAYGGYFRVTFAGAPAEGTLVPLNTSTVPTNDKGGVIGLFSPEKTAQNLRIEFIPAGASSLPIELLLYPYTPTSHVPEWVILD